MKCYCCGADIEGWCMEFKDSKGNIYYQCSRCTYERIGELKKEMKGIMEIKYDVKIPFSDAEDINAVFDFMEGDHTNMKLVYGDVKEAISRRSVLKRTAERNGWNVEVSRVNNAVFVVKGDK